LKIKKEKEKEGWHEITWKCETKLEQQGGYIKDQW
jgi:hypothetical protein